jgi:DNA mismatch repair protein MutL
VSRIHLLPDALISQIAAGEVVERPASVVKELLENALDAGAREVEVQLAAGGKGEIAVADDGCGMGRDDALLAFDRHATSKIASYADLERVGTLGFRGEALATIAAVSRLDLTTAETAGEGTRVAIEGGRVRVAEPCSRPRGTTITARSLFFNVPARRKFLKTPQTELRRCLDVVEGYALARPEVRIRVLHEGRELLDALATAEAGTRGGSRERIGQIFGDAFAARLAELPARGAGEGPGEQAEGLGDSSGEGRRVERIAGFVGLPETARGRRSFVFVNGRLIRDRAVFATFYRAVRDEWKSEQFPAFFLFLDLPPEEVDVNVHPQKAEVRFRDPGLLDRVYHTLRLGLERARGEEGAPLRLPPRGPEVPFAWQGLGEKGAAWPRARSGAAGDWSATGSPNGIGTGDGPEGTGERWGSAGLAAAGEVRDSSHSAWSPSRVAAPSYVPIERAIIPLSGRTGEARPFRLLGQYKGTLLLLEGPDGLYLVDQHVAHERLLYERLRRALLAAEPPVQHLLTPVLLELTAAERLRLSELAPRLAEHGFEIVDLSGNTLALTSIPAVLKTAEAEALLRELAGDRGEGVGPADELRRRILEGLAASMACKAAVKMHHPLSPPEMEALVAELFAAEQPYACPHGRPIVLQMTDADLERRFGRR